jgi:GGDEF domain-containing protein
MQAVPDEAFNRWAAHRLRESRNPTLYEDRLKRLVPIFDALLTVTLVAWVGLSYWPLPVAIVALLGIGAIQLLVVRLHLGEPQIVEERHERLVASVQKQVDGVRRTAMYDSTVGLYQRWYLEQRLKQECARCRRYGLSLAIIVVHFTRLDKGDYPEDEWQTEAVQAAYVTSCSIRNVDLAAIISDMEFAISLVHCDADGARMAMSRIAGSLEDHEFQMGAAVYPDDDLEPAELIELARSRVGKADAGPLPEWPAEDDVGLADAG